MTRIIIKAVPERSEFIRYLRDRLPTAEWCLDSERCAMGTLLKSLAMAGEDAAIHMEEDILLAPEFERRAAEAIADLPFAVIQFFSMRGADLTVGSRWDRNYLMNQCVYLPAGYASAILDYAPAWIAKNKPQRGHGTDPLIRDFLKDRRERYWIHVPSLVQHRVTKSVIDPRRSSRRQSETFTLHFGEGA